MITRTCAADFASQRIFMNSVDTGWITQEHGTEVAAEMKFTPPIDDIDGAARVLDPVFVGERDHVYAYGLFLKHFHPTDW